MPHLKFRRAAYGCILTFGLALSACGGGGGGGTGSSSQASASQTNTLSEPHTPLQSDTNQPGNVIADNAKVSITGKITFEQVPHSMTGFGLDYAASLPLPARGIIVEAIDSAGVVHARTYTNESGEYLVQLDPDLDIAIRALAELSRDDVISYAIKIADNTADYTPYALQGSFANIGDTDSVRDLHASSGWDGVSYSSPRSAAPFAILNPLYEALELLISVDADLALPPLTIGWSPNNSTAYGRLSDGQIASSHYDLESGNIYILGKADSDTDEYDPHVIVHEFAHYLDDQLSRADNIGGAHNPSDFLDPRVAMGEGFGNAFAAIVLDDPIYKDALNIGQASGFEVDIEDNAPRIFGWYSEASVHSLIYDFYDQGEDGIDRLSIGFAPIYKVMTQPAYTEAAEFTTIYNLTDELRGELNIAEQEQMDLLLLAQGITGKGKTGEGEYSHGGLTQSLPLYKQIEIGGPATNLCSVNEKGTGNQLGNYAFAKLSIAQLGQYDMTVSALQSNLVTTDPDFRLYRSGELIFTSESLVDNEEIWSGELEPGAYIVSVYDYENSRSFAKGREGCFALSVTSK